MCRAYFKLEEAADRAPRAFKVPQGTRPSAVADASTRGEVPVREAAEPSLPDAASRDDAESTRPNLAERRDGRRRRRRSRRGPDAEVAARVVHAPARGRRVLVVGHLEDRPEGDARRGEDAAGDSRVFVAARRPATVREMHVTRGDARREDEREDADEDGITTSADDLKSRVEKLEIRLDCKMYALHRKKILLEQRKCKVERNAERKAMLKRTIQEALVQKEADELAKYEEAQKEFDAKQKQLRKEKKVWEFLQEETPKKKQKVLLNAINLTD